MDFYFLVYIHDNSEKKGEKNFTENDSEMLEFHGE